MMRYDRWHYSSVNVNVFAHSLVHFFQAIQDLIRQSSLPMYSFVDHTGYWRQVCIRRNLLGQLMVIVQIHPQNLSEVSISVINF